MPCLSAHTASLVENSGNSMDMASIGMPFSMACSKANLDSNLLRTLDVKEPALDGDLPSTYCSLQTSKVSSALSVPPAFTSSKRSGPRGPKGSRSSQLVEKLQSRWKYVDGRLALKADSSALPLKR